METKNIIQALIIAFLTGVVGLFFQYIDPPTILTELWQRVFVGPWFVWLGAAGFGIYWLVRLLVKLHQDTTRTIPELLKANKELAGKELLAKTQSLEILLTASDLSLEQEKQNRVAGDDGLSDRINRLDIRTQKDLSDGLDTIKTQLLGVFKNEAHERTEGINAINRRLDVDFERVNKLDTSLPTLTLARIQELEKKLTTQISALDKRVEKIEPRSLLDMGPQKGVGLINAFRPGPSQAELLADAIKNRDKKT